MTQSIPDPLDPRLSGFQAGLAGRYQIVRQIGEGGMAVVLLAHDLQHDRPVALKVLHPELTRALGGERFHQEVRLTAKVQHPHIVSIYDSGETDGHLWYSMPFIEGESLRQRLTREEQLPVPEALRIILEAARAMAAAHQAGIVHRDIKPENLLLTPAGDVYVVDFGVARAVDSASLTRTGLAVGTPQYMSPEQASGKTEVNARSDVYTLGCVLYEMLAGEPPYNSKTPQAISAKHLQAPIPDVRIIRETVSEAVQQVLRTALAKSPADRYADAGALAKAVEEAMAAPRAATGWHPRRAAVVAATIVGISAAAYGIMQGWQQKPAARPAHKSPPTIAVLYFEHPDPDTSLRSIADDVTEEVIRELTGAGNAFSVVSKLGVRQFKEGRTSIDSMRVRLDADYWVAGEIRRVGSRLVVQAQLIDALTNLVIDSLSARSSGGSPHELAANAALEVASSIRQKLNLEVRLVRLMDTSTVAIANSLEREAERYRLEAEYYRGLPNSKNVRSAMTAFERADSALARASREDSTWLKPWISRSWVVSEQAYLESLPARVVSLQRALKYADEAVRRAPDNAAALEARGTVRYKLVSALNADDTLQMGLAEKDLRNAVGRDSLNARAWATLGDIYWTVGKLDESEVASRTALRVDPFLSNAASVKGTLYVVTLFLGKFSEAREWCRHMRIGSPGDWYSQQCGLTLLRHDASQPPNPALAWREVALLDSLDPADKARASGHPYTPVYRRLLAATIEARAGNTAKAESVLVSARRMAAGDSVTKLDMAMDEALLLWALGRPGEGRKLVDRYVRLRPTQVPALMRDPLYREVMLP